VEVAPATTQPTGNGGGAGAPPIDPLLVVLVAFLGFLGLIIYRIIKGMKKGEPPKKPKEPGDYCKEHPEVVEAEKKACDDAQWDLDQALGPIEEQLDAYRQQWREMSREIGRLLMEWDTAYAVIQSLTKSEKAIREDSEKVQKVAGIVKPGGSLAKTAFKKGGEEAMKELGKHVAQEVGKGIAGEVSSTVGDLLGLEEWAMSEIGIGVAKLITGIDPKKEASDLRKQSVNTCSQLQSWVDLRHARSTRYSSTTLQSCIEDAERLKADIDKALKDFEDRVAGFKCIKCKVDPGLMERINQMQRELDDFIKAFGDMIDQIQQRLSQAAALYGRKDVYDSPYEWASGANNLVPDIEKTLRNMGE
jgi:DNA repair exonuclease SbcCD ATPase subunit